MAKLCFVYGTRPEAIKIAPVVKELRKLLTFIAVGYDAVSGKEVEAELEADHEIKLICTGQHTTLLEGTPAKDVLLNDSVPMYLASDGNVFAWTNRAMMDLHEILKSSVYYANTIVVVQGDTMTAIAAARAARLCNYDVAHIEAGLRSGMLSDPWPEEGFRQEIAQLADYHFAPTEVAAANLRREGVAPEAVWVTGNPIVSAVAEWENDNSVTMLTAPVGFGEETVDYEKPPNQEILVTLHRRELQQRPDELRELVNDLQAASKGNDRFCFTWIVHPSIQALDLGVVPTERLRLISHMAYNDLLDRLRSARGVITDSGGLQEEAAILGVPCAVMRRVSDRPESIAEGMAQTFGYDVLLAIDWLGRQSDRRALDCYGTEDSAANIAAKLKEIVDGL